MNTGNEKTDERSRQKLSGVHPTLRSLVTDFATHSHHRFIVTEGVRTPARQAELVKAGASRTMNSKHLTGRAVDIAVVVDGEVRWDWPLYRTFAADLKSFARANHVNLIAGADWLNFPDGPHFELAKDVS